jgi:hypothetical protein
MGITANSLPEYSRISHVNNTLKDTLYFTEKLTNANNHAARRIAFDSLNKLEDKLTDLTGDFGDSLVNVSLNTPSPVLHSKVA